MFLSHLYRAIKLPFRPSFSSSSAVASSSLAQGKLPMTSAKQLVDNKIGAHRIVVFSKTYCPYCRETKQYFAKNYPHETVEVVELDERGDGGSIQDYLKDITGARSVPRTFINGNSIGGNDDLHAKSKGEIDDLLAKRA